jgi:hypothetical protein
MARYRPNVDYTSASQVDEGGHAAFIPKTEMSDATGTALGTAGNPLVVSATSGGAGGATTGTVFSVASSAASVSLLASNANRKGATITNTDANTLRLLLSAGTASATNYTAPIASGGYYEVPFGFTGQIVGIWDADGAGVALMTELT